MAEENDEFIVSDKGEDKTRPGPSKRAKYATDAGKYNTRFPREWTKILPFIVRQSVCVSMYLVSSPAHYFEPTSEVFNRVFISPTRT